MLEDMKLLDQILHHRVDDSNLWYQNMFFYGKSVVTYHVLFVKFIATYSAFSQITMAARPKA
jgi:hypothetical protein